MTSRLTERDRSAAAGRTPLAASSAQGAAALRAAAGAERDDRLRSPDYLAARFVSFAPRLTLLVKVPMLRRLASRLAERLIPGSYWFELARLKHMDALLRQGLELGARQLVILGAGFDTRAYRFAGQLADVRTFEVDHPLTAAKKRERVRVVFGALPDHVRYVEADLNRDDLGARLESAGYDPAARTFIIWSGVTGYLAPTAVDAVLRWFVRHAAPGSSIVFDYLFRDMVDGDDSYYGAAELRRRLADAGEPLTFGLSYDSAREFLARRGLEMSANLDARALERRYLTDPDGRIAGKVYDFVGIAHARVPKGDLHAARADGLPASSATAP